MASWIGKNSNVFLPAINICEPVSKIARQNSGILMRPLSDFRKNAANNSAAAQKDERRTLEWAKQRTRCHFDAHFFTLPSVFYQSNLQLGFFYPRLHMFRENRNGRFFFFLHRLYWIADSTQTSIHYCRNWFILFASKNTPTGFIIL